MATLHHKEILKVLSDIEKEYVENYAKSSGSSDKKFYLYGLQAVRKVRGRLVEFIVKKYR